ncbi:MAG: class I SAM-dependent methyltransferase [Bacilli bacterium]
MQKEHSQINESAWSERSYEAWVNRYGLPHEAAQRIKKDPAGRLSSLYKHIGDVNGKKVINLLGSHGSKAIALSLLGADTTVVDISSENARYANELAEAASTHIRYIVSDVLELPSSELSSDYDLVLIELGILHYFTDLQPFIRIISQLLRVGGLLVLQDFHPVSTKLITSSGKKHKVTGDYFSTTLEESDVAYIKFLPDMEFVTKEEKKHLTVRLRKWTLGEIITAIASEGLFIKLLIEEGNTKPVDLGIPKTFTLVAEKV